MYVYIYFSLFVKKAHAFHELELILFEKIGEVKELKHWLLSPESQDTIQGLMNCTCSCSVIKANPQALKIICAGSVYRNRYSFESLFILIRI